MKLKYCFYLQIWTSVIFMRDFLSSQHHFTATRLKIHQWQQNRTWQNISIPAMAFVFDHVTGLGLGAMSPSGNRRSPKSSSLEGAGEETHNFTSDGNWGSGSPTRQGLRECVAGVYCFKTTFYLQNQGCDIWRIRAQIRYCLQFIMVQLSVDIKKQ